MDCIAPTTCCSILPEYDALIINHEYPIGIPGQRIDQLNDFLKAPRKVFVYILNNVLLENLSNYEFVKPLLYMQVGMGKTTNLLLHGYSGSDFDLTEFGKRSAFAEYLDKGGKSWEIALRQELSENVIPLALNRSKDIVAFSLKGLESRTFFIPWSDNEDLFWNSIVTLLYSAEYEIEPAPDWADSYFPPGLKEQKAEITRIQAEIVALESEKRKHEAARDILEDIRDTLLCRHGMLLQDAVRSVFRLLGLGAENGPEGQEDLRFVENQNHFVVEVKGLKKSAAESHVAELHKHRSAYEATNGVKAKAVLILNPWRELPLEERDTSSQRNFPDNVLKKANLFEVALLTTQQLFVAYCQMLEGKFDKDEFIQKLMKTNGVFEGLDEIEKYKVGG